MKRRIFVLVPSPHPTGPVKGAMALANALAAEREVTLVTLKPGPGADAPLDPRVRTISLADRGAGLPARVSAYRAVLREAGGRPRVASISMCLSADLVNRFCRAEAVTCASVRGNLPGNYRLDYGLPGIPLAIAHLALTGGFDHVTAMTEAMAGQVRRYARRRPAVIGNFVDEAPLLPFRAAAPDDPPLRFVFVGSLSERKRPLLTVEAIARLRADGIDARLDIVGDGPLASAVRAELARHGLADAVLLHGQVKVPQAIVARAHALVLPSLAEGLSRAALEALFLGVPCVLRDADGNRELLKPGVSGVLFGDDADLPAAMRAAAALGGRAGELRPNLLPAAFRQDIAARQYLTLVEEGTAVPVPS